MPQEVVFKRDSASFANRIILETESIERSEETYTKSKMAESDTFLTEIKLTVIINSTVIIILAAASD